jgi:iron complex transport system ATP-binding protein
LRDLNFWIEQGKFFSIIGPNGSGKTTLLNVMTGSLKKNTGEVLFLGETIDAYPIERLARFFAIINQRVTIQFPFTCLEIVMMGRHPFTKRMQQLTKADMEIVYDAMSATDTLKFAETLVTEVSGGEFQRVMFARALAQKPQVLFLDEAFSGMDMSHRLNSLKMIKHLVQEERLTAIAIMHDLNLAYSFSDEVIVLKGGRIQGHDIPKRLMTAPFINAVFDVNVHHVEDKGLIVIP